MARPCIVVASTLVLTTLAAAQPSHLELVAQTPCLEEYRLWLYSSRRPDKFPRPTQFTQEQCDEAVKVNDRMLDEQLREAEQLRRAQAEEQERRAEAKRREPIEREEAEKRAAAWRAADERKQKQADKVRKAAAMAADRVAEAKRAEQMSKPYPRLGMTSSQAFDGTNWGRPQGINRTIDARGTSEQWVFGPRQYLYFQNGVLVTIQD